MGFGGEYEEKCYAASRGDCEGPLTKEHYITDAGMAALNEAGDREVIVSGFPWQLDGETARTRITHMTARILCRKHNNDLSPVDQAGSEFLVALRAATNGATKVYTINGARLERWMLKCLMGTVAANVSRSQDGKPLEPNFPAVWLRMLFGDEGFPVHAGLYLSTKPGETLKMKNAIEFAPIGMPVPYGARVKLRELEFIFSGKISGERPSGHLIEGAHYRPAVFQFETAGGVPTTKIELMWPKDAFGGFGTLAIGYHPTRPAG